MESQRYSHIMYTGLDALDLSGRTPLMYAVIAEALQCIEVLIEYGALREQVLNVQRILIDALVHLLLLDGS